MSSSSLCNCPAPNADCRRAGVPMVGRLWELCHGVNCTIEVSDAYRRLWDGPKRSLLPSRSPCIHLGSPTGERRVCTTCRGRVELKVFACRHPEHRNDPTTTEIACRSCSDYTL